MVLVIFFITLFLLALPLGELSRVSFSLVTAITLLDIVVGVGSIVYLLKQIQKRSLPKTPQAKAYLIFIGILTVSLLAQVPFLPSNELFVGGLYLLRYAVYGLLFFLVFALSKRDKKKAALMLGLGGSMLLITGFLQFFWYPSLRNLYYAGWDEHYYRMFGTFLDPNFFGLFLVGYFLFMVHGLLKASRPFVKGLLSLLVFLTGIAIVLTYSRTALLALFIGIVIYFGKHLFQKKVLLGMAGFILIGVSVTVLVGRHAVGNDFFRVMTADARLGDMKNALIIFSQKPLLGVGFNTYRYAQYQNGFVKPQPGIQDHGAAGSDNSFLFVLATSGIVGLAGFLYLLWVHSKALYTSGNRWGLATLGAFCFGSVFVNGLFYPLLLVWLWSVLGLSESNSQ